jgi:hypothetical protein
MEVLQVALVWLCLVADPSQCEVRKSEPFMAPYATADQRICKKQIVDMAVKVNQTIEDGWVVVTTACELENVRG